MSCFHNGTDITSAFVIPRCYRVNTPHTFCRKYAILNIFVSENHFYDYHFVMIGISVSKLLLSVHQQTKQARNQPTNQPTK